MSFEADLRLPAIEAYVVASHGSRRALTPDEEDVLTFYGELILDYVVQRWPVDTGTSQDAMEIVTSVSPGEYGYTIGNPMFYAQYVHPQGTPKIPELWKTLVPEAFGTYRAPLVVALKQAIDETEARIAVVVTTRERPTTARGRAREAALDVFRSPLQQAIRRLAGGV